MVPAYGRPVYAIAVDPRPPAVARIEKLISRQILSLTGEFAAAVVQVAIYDFLFFFYYIPPSLPSWPLTVIIFFLTFFYNHLPIVAGMYILRTFHDSLCLCKRYIIYLYPMKMIIINWFLNDNFHWGVRYLW